MSKTVDLNGQLFGCLTALYPTDNRKHGSVVWMCSCKCGTKNVEVSASSLVSGNTLSCGCIVNGHNKTLAIRAAVEYYQKERIKKICANTECGAEFETLSKNAVLCLKCDLKKRLGTKPSKYDW